MLGVPSESPLLGTHSSLDTASGEEGNGSFCPRVLPLLVRMGLDSPEKRPAGLGGGLQFGAAAQLGRPVGKFSHSTALGKIQFHTWVLIST